MKIGICTSLSNAPLAVESGFDYVELSVAEMVQREPWEAEPYEGLPIEACNLFFPSGTTLFPLDQFDPRALDIRAYMKTAKERLQELGVQVAVVGSGNQRRCPEAIDFPYKPVNGDPDLVGASSPEEAFARMVKWFADIPGTPIPAPESLERSETNVGQDCASFSRILKENGVDYTADSYHLMKEWDADGREGGLSTPSKEFWENQLPHAPAHLHLAQLEYRSFPRPKDPMLEGFFARLRELGYDARVSLECSAFDPSDYKQAIANLRTYFA